MTGADRAVTAIEVGSREVLPTEEGRTVKLNEVEVAVAAAGVVAAGPLEVANRVWDGLHVHAIVVSALCIL